MSLRSVGLGPEVGVGAVPQLLSVVYFAGVFSHEGLHLTLDLNSCLPLQFVERVPCGAT